MSEGYVFSTAIDVNDLLNQVVGQAAAHGWTQHFLGGNGGNGRRGHISKDGCVVNLCSNIASNVQNGGTVNLNEVIPSAARDSALSYQWNDGYSSRFQPDVLCINAGTAYNGSLPWYGQPGADCKSDAQPDIARFRMIRAKGAIGSVHMFFFENPAAFIVIAEVRAGEFYWLSAGNLLKDYDFPGGQFYGASLADHELQSGYPVAAEGFQLRCAHAKAVPGRGNSWGGFVSSPNRAVAPTQDIPSGQRVPGPFTRTSGSSTPNSNNVDQVQRGYSPTTGRLWATSPRVYVDRAGGGKSYLGLLPHFHFISTMSFVGGEEASVGGVIYSTFPWNFRVSPYDWDATTFGSANANQSAMRRNNTLGSGWMIRKPM